MYDIVEYLNEDAEMAAIEVDDVEGAVFRSQGPVLATPFALVPAAAVAGYVVGRAQG